MDPPVETLEYRLQLSRWNARAFIEHPNRDRALGSLAEMTIFEAGGEYLAALPSNCRSARLAKSGSALTADMRSGT